MDALAVVSRLAGDFVLVGFVLAAFTFGRIVHDSQKPRWRAWLVVPAAVLVLSFVVAVNMGSHVVDADPLYGGGYAVADYEPTSAQRQERFLHTLGLLGLPALYGLYRADQASES